MNMDLNDNEKKNFVKQLEKNKNFFQSLRHAIDGACLVIKKERNMHYHLSVAFIVFIVGLYFNIGRSDWLWLSVAIFGVITAEFLNTIVESIVDLVVGQKYNELAKIAKDVAAASTLIAAIFAVVIGLIIFEPYVKYWLLHY